MPPVLSGVSLPAQASMAPSGLALTTCRALPGVKVDEARLAGVCARYGIARLDVFGSLARGTAPPDSDIDVLYALGPGAGWAGRSSSSPTSSLSFFGRHVDLVSLRRSTGG